MTRTLSHDIFQYGKHQKRKETHRRDRKKDRGKPVKKIRIEHLYKKIQGSPKRGIIVNHFWVIGQGGR